MKSVYITGVGDVTVADVPQWDFLYQTSTVRNPKFRISDRVVLPDGRVFRYGLATEALGSRLAFNGNVIPGIAATQGYEGALYAQAEAGEHKVKIADTTTRAVDNYRGGTFVMFGGTDFFCAGILGSSTVVSVAGAAAYVELTLDAALPYTGLVAYGITAYPSIYGNLLGASGVDTFQCAVGLPTRGNTAAGSYAWIQTWGPCWVTAMEWGSTGPGCAADLRDVYVHTDGTIMPAIDSSGVAKQRVGSVLYMGDGSAYGDGVIMLQISP